MSQVETAAWRRSYGAIHALKRAAFIVGRLDALRDHDAADFFRERELAFATEAEQLVDAAHWDLEAGSEDLDRDWTLTTSLVTAFLIWLQTGDRPPESTWDDFAACTDKLNRYPDLFETPKLRYLR